MKILCPTRKMFCGLFRGWVDILARQKSNFFITYGHEIVLFGIEILVYFCVSSVDEDLAKSLILITFTNLNTDFLLSLGMDFLFYCP